jgi:predicted RNase H-like nuclease (RuvC/YqgF family)
MAAAYNDIFGCGVPEQEARDCEAAATLSILSKRPASVLTPSAPEFKRQRLSDLDAEVPEEPESPRLLSTADVAAIERLKIKVRKLKAESQEFQAKFYELQEKYLRQKSRARKDLQNIRNDYKSKLLELEAEIQAEKSDRLDIVKSLERYEALPALNLSEVNPLTLPIKKTERTLSTFKKPTFAQQPPVVTLQPPSEIFDDVADEAACFDGFDAAAEFQETFDAAVAVAAAAAADEAEEEAAADAAAAFAIADAAGFYRTDAGDNDFERPVQQDQELVEDYILRLSSWEALYMY